MIDKRLRPYGYLALAFVAGTLIYIGDRFAWPSLQAVGGGLIGAGLLAVGVDSLRTRFFDIGVDAGSLRSSSRFVFRGPGAISWALMCLALGLAFITLAAIVLCGLVEEAEQLIAERPGLLIAPLGFIFLSSAGGWLWGEELMNSSLTMALATLPHRIGALIAVLFSLVVLAVGIFELVAPAAFDQLIDSLRPPPFPELPSR